jgi:protocatechuate 3,4-dioxygenase beta subunit
MAPLTAAARWSSSLSTKHAVYLSTIFYVSGKPCDKLLSTGHPRPTLAYNPVPNSSSNQEQFEERTIALVSANSQMTPKNWSRRNFLTSTAGSAFALGASRYAHAWPASASQQPCVLNAEQTEGPYYIDEGLLRKDITEGKSGLLLRLRLTVLDLATCKPVPNAALDIWHCDAAGVYSGYTKAQLGARGPGGMPFPPPDSASGGPPLGPPPGSASFRGQPPMGRPPKMQPSDNQTFLRGVQLTNEQGIVEFRTIFPGAYAGRVNHIHLKVHIGGQTAADKYTDGHVAHTGQIFFPEEITKAVLARAPYSTHQIRRTTLDEDNVFTTQNGQQGLAHLTLINPASPADGYVAEVLLGVNPGSTPTSEEPGPPRR